MVALLPRGWWQKRQVLYMDSNVPRQSQSGPCWSGIEGTSTGIARCRSVRSQLATYSVCNAVSGSTRIALHAGTRHAIVATAAKNRLTVTNVVRSVGSTANSIC